MDSEMLNRALFSSDRHDWQTPDDMFRQLDAEFGFEIDVFAVSREREVPALLLSGAQWLGAGLARCAG